MANNPFYVDPTAGHDPSAMSGLSRALFDLGEQRERREAQEKAEIAAQEKQGAIMAAFESGDPEQMSMVAAQYPDVSDLMYKQIGVTDDRQKSELAAFTRDVLTSNPDQIEFKFQERIRNLENQGRDASHSIEQYQDWLENPEGEIKDMRAFYAGVDPNGSKIVEGMLSDKPEKKTTLQQNLEAAGLEPGSADYQQAILDYIKKPSTSVTIGDAKTLEKASEGQLAAAGFAERVNQSNMELAALVDGGFDPTSPKLPIAETLPGGNIILSDDAQLYKGAKEDFITAVLRKESGAAIGQDEFEREDKKYFPQVGDGKKTIKAKRKRRERQFEVLKRQSKGVYGAQYGDSKEAEGKDLGAVLTHPEYGDVSEADIQETMRANNLTREQVIERLK